MGVGGVAQQRDAALVPGRHGVAVEQAPFENGVGPFEQAYQVGMPALERAQQFLAAARRIP